MPLAQPETVDGGDFGATMGRPGGPALRPAPPIAGAGRVPVRLVGEASRPTPLSRVLSGRRFDLFHDARRQPAACERREAHTGPGGTAAQGRACPSRLGGAGKAWQGLHNNFLSRERSAEGT